MIWFVRFLATGAFAAFTGWYAVADDDFSFIGPYDDLDDARAVACAIMIDGDTPLLTQAAT